MAHKKFALIKDFTGYLTKRDSTNTSIRNLVSGSQNMIINDEEKVESRAGYTLDGPSNNALNAIESSFDWDGSIGIARNLRGYDDELEVRFVDAAGDINWVRVGDSWNNVAFSFATWWDTTENMDVLLFVRSNDSIHEWSGGIVEVSSVTSSTIVKLGTSTWHDEHFYDQANRTIQIEGSGTVFTYTGGESTTTLTGVTPDPSANGVVAGSFMTQQVRERTNEPAAGERNNIIAVLNNQLYVGSSSTNEVRVSSNTDYTDFTFSSPRAPGEGATLTIDGFTSAIIPQEEDMYIGGSTNDWYRTTFNEIESTGLKESLTVKKLKSAPQQGPQSNDLVGKIKNAIVFISNEPTLEQLGQIENVVTPQSKPISDPIKPDFDDGTFTNGHIKFHRNRLYIALPADDKLLIYDIAKGFWHPPQLLPIRRLTIIGGNLYFHSNAVPETYRLFDGVDDNGNPILFRAKFAYRNFGDRGALKNFDEFFSELFISTNTTVTLQLRYDFEGATTVQEFAIDGADDDLLFIPVADNSLGLNSLGTEPIGGLTQAPNDLNKIRHIAPTTPIDFFEIQVIYESSDEDAQFQVLSHGPAIRFAKSHPTYLSKST